MNAFTGVAEFKELVSYENVLYILFLFVALYVMVELTSLIVNAVIKLIRHIGLSICGTLRDMFCVLFGREKSVPTLHEDFNQDIVKSIGSLKRLFLCFPRIRVSFGETNKDPIDTDSKPVGFPGDDKDDAEPLKEAC